jgi:flagellar basal-body rod protein FlgF
MRRGYIKVIILLLAANPANATYETISSVALSGQVAYFNNLEVIANNLANVNTHGFKEKYLIYRAYSSYNGNNYTVSYTQDISSIRNMEDGPLVGTRRDLDIAIVGDAYLVVETEGGEQLYTKHGSLFVNNRGLLVNRQGHRILTPKKADIVIPRQAGVLIIKEDGTININGEDINRLGIVKFDNSYELKDIGGSLYRSPDTNAELTPEAGDFQIVQGFLEGSNVNKIQNLVSLIETQRTAGIMSNLMNSYDDITRNTISKLGRN